MESAFVESFDMDAMELRRLREENEKLKQKNELLVKKCKYLEEENKKFHALNEDVLEQAKQWIQEDTKVIKALEMSNILLRRKVQMYEYREQCKVSTERIIPEINDENDNN